MSETNKSGFTVPERLTVWTWINQGVCPEIMVRRINQRRKTEKMKKYGFPEISESDIRTLSGFFKSAQSI